MTSGMKKKYIKKCNKVLMSNNKFKANRLVNRIIAKLGTDLLSAKTQRLYSKNNPDESFTILNDIKMILESSLNNAVPYKKYDLIYICYAEEDEEFASKTIDLLIDIGVEENQIISKLIENHLIPSKCKYDRYEYIRKVFKNNSVLTIFLLSNYTYENTVCMMEMGAVWVLKTDYYSIVSPNFHVVTEGAINPRINTVEMSQNESKIKLSLLELKTTLETCFNINTITETRWEKKRDEYIADIKSLYNAKPENNSMALDAKRVIEELQSKKIFTISAITKLGYSEIESKEILSYLAKNGIVKKETVGRYIWKKK